MFGEQNTKGKAAIKAGKIRAKDATEAKTNFKNSGVFLISEETLGETLRIITVNQFQFYGHQYFCYSKDFNSL